MSFLGLLTGVWLGGLLTRTRQLSGSYLNRVSATATANPYTFLGRGSLCERAWVIKPWCLTPEDTCKKPTSHSAFTFQGGSHKLEDSHPFVSVAVILTLAG